VPVAVEAAVNVAAADGFAVDAVVAALVAVDWTSLANCWIYCNKLCPIPLALIEDMAIPFVQ
jgi:hypothetical protein